MSDLRGTLALAKFFGAKFQNRAGAWMRACFPPAVCFDKTERNHRFLEEALELVQSLGCARSDAHMLVEYVFNRPIGEPSQEVGGTVVTLALLCAVHDLDMVEAGEIELSRILLPEIMEKIRAKQATKPQHSPLPSTV